jgi:hypothetical protein
MNIRNLSNDELDRALDMAIAAGASSGDLFAERSRRIRAANPFAREIVTVPLSPAAIGFMEDFILPAVAEDHVLEPLVEGAVILKTRIKAHRMVWEAASFDEDWLVEEAIARSDAETDAQLAFVEKGARAMCAALEARISKAVAS